MAAMRSRWTVMMLAGAVATLLLGVAAIAQTEPRKVKSKVTPTYPDLARRMNIVGKTKIEVTISPEGKVRSSRAVGGHPLLVQACLDAVKEWKFVAGPEESKQIVECDFGG
jgi:TonB family protein